MAFPISGERDTYSVNRGETSYHGEQIKINSNLTQKLQMKGEGIRGKRKVLIMDSGPCTLHLYASIQFHLLPVFPLLTLLNHSKLLTVLWTLQGCSGLRAFAHAVVLFVLSSFSTNNNMTCSRTLSGCNLNITFLRNFARSNKQDPFFTIYQSLHHALLLFLALVSPDFMSSLFLSFLLCRM